MVVDCSQNNSDIGMAVCKTLVQISGTAALLRFFFFNFNATAGFRKVRQRNNWPTAVQRLATEQDDYHRLCIEETDISNCTPKHGRHVWFGMHMTT